MKIVLLEDLGVAAHVLERHMQKLESMGIPSRHIPRTQTPRSKSREAGMPMF